MFSLVITDGGRSNGGATAESFESSIDDFSGFVVNLNLELHDVATRGCTNKTRSDGGVVLVEGSNVAGVIVVVHHPLVVEPRQNPNPQWWRLQRPRSNNCLRASSDSQHFCFFLFCGRRVVLVRDSEEEDNK